MNELEKIKARFNLKERNGFYEIRITSQRKISPRELEKNPDIVLYELLIIKNNFIDYINKEIREIQEILQGAE